MSEPSSRPLLEVRDLAVEFDGRRVLEGVSLSVGRGETVVVIGESGCGKTVLLKCMIGLLEPSAGHVIYDGVDIGTLDDRTLTKLRARLGFVFQGAALFDSMTVADNVAFGLREQTDFDAAKIERIVRERLHEVGLDPDEVWAKKPAELSGGMRKRAGLARALALGPEMVLYDEPTTGLDPIMSDVINELMLQTRRKHTVTAVVVTHDMRSAFKVGDRIVMLYEGRIIAEGTPEEFRRLSDPRVSQFVKGEARDRLQAMAASREEESSS